MITIELHGFDERGANGVPPNPWWATSEYTSPRGRVRLTSVRRATSWLAIADVILQMHPHLSDAPFAGYRKVDPEWDGTRRIVLEAGASKPGHIQVTKPQDGRYIPSRRVYYSKQERVTMESAKARDAVDHLVSLVRAILAEDALPNEGRREPLEEALKAYLAARELDDLDLPWRARVMSTTPEHGKRYWRVVDCQDRTIAESLTQGQAKLMAQSGDMARKLEDWLTDEDYLESVDVEYLLVEAGWVKR